MTLFYDYEWLFIDNYIRWMSLGKHQSVTSDTKATHSFHNSVNANQKIAKQLLQSQQCQLLFLRDKNRQLQQRITRMTSHISQLQQNKVDLLHLNQKYVVVMNEYYRKMSKPSGKQNQDQNQLLKSLELDHRNLVKHCLNMEKQIKNYAKEMEKFNLMKKELYAVNHSNTKELIQELRSLAEENKNLKMDNNKLGFELEKLKLECGRLKKGKEQWQDKADIDGDQLEKYKSLINTIQQESSDKSHNYEAKIYELQVKVEKLEKQLREGQTFWLRTKQIKRKLQIAEVEHVHERDHLRMSVREKKSQAKIKNSVSFYQ